MDELEVNDKVRAVVSLVISIELVQIMRRTHALSARDAIGIWDKVRQAVRADETLAGSLVELASEWALSDAQADYRAELDRASAWPAEDIDDG